MKDNMQFRETSGSSEKRVKEVGDKSGESERRYMEGKSSQKERE